MAALQWYRNSWPWLAISHFALKSVSGYGLASPAFEQNCSKICRATHILSATKMQPRERGFWQYMVYADTRGGSLGRGVKWECGSWKWRSSLLSFTVFRTFYTHGQMTAFTWCDCRWPWRHFKVIRLFHIKFFKNGASYGKSYYRILIGNHTLAFDWCQFWWPWMIFEGYFTLPSPISRKLYRIRPQKLKLLIKKSNVCFQVIRMSMALAIFQ